jgi:large subunit ribosomal protein L6
VGITLKIEGSNILVLRADDSRENRAKHGLVRAHLANMVKGVTDGWVRELEINGVGYRAEVTGDTLNMALGYSHPVVFKLPKGISAKVDKNRVSLSGSDRDLLGQTAAKVRELRPPEPYKGKGVKYVEETIKKKVGKAGATGSGAK